MEEKEMTKKEGGQEKDLNMILEDLLKAVEALPDNMPIKTDLMEMASEMMGLLEGPDEGIAETPMSGAEGLMQEE